MPKKDASQPAPSYQAEGEESRRQGLIPIVGHDGAYEEDNEEEEDKEVVFNFEFFPELSLIHI